MTKARTDRHRADALSLYDVTIVSCRPIFTGSTICNRRRFRRISCSRSARCRRATVAGAARIPAAQQHARRCAPDVRGLSRGRVDRPRARRADFGRSDPLPRQRTLGRRRRDGQDLRRALDLEKLRQRRRRQGHARRTQHARKAHRTTCSPNSSASSAPDRWKSKRQREGAKARRKTRKK